MLAHISLPPPPWCRAHQAILTARSQHFRNLFAQRKAKQQRKYVSHVCVCCDGGNSRLTELSPARSTEIKVKKVTLETFKRLLEFVYRDHIASDMTKGVATQLAQVHTHTHTHFGHMVQSQLALY